MPQMIHVENCPICDSKVYVKLVGPHVSKLPDEVYTCRCRLVYPERFERAGQHGYAVKRRGRVRPRVW